MKPVIVDYGVGNLRSVERAFHRLGVESEISNDPARVADAAALVLPGVGAFGDAIDKLRQSGLDDVVIRFARDEQRPLLGICLGMQLLARSSEENGNRRGLGLIDASVVPLTAASHDLPLPHMGWNAVKPQSDSTLFGGIPDGADFYFVHSYQVVCDDADAVEAICEYGKPFCCAVRAGNVCGVQFHPEKSQKFGRTVLENFVRLAQQG